MGNYGKQQILSDVAAVGDVANYIQRYEE